MLGIEGPKGEAELAQFVETAIETHPQIDDERKMLVLGTVVGNDRHQKVGHLEGGKVPRSGLRTRHHGSKLRLDVEAQGQRTRQYCEGRLQQRNQASGQRQGRPEEIDFGDRSNQQTLLRLRRQQVVEGRRIDPQRHVVGRARGRRGAVSRQRRWQTQRATQVDRRRVRVQSGERDIHVEGDAVDVDHSVVEESGEFELESGADGRPEFEADQRLFEGCGHRRVAVAVDRVQQVLHLVLNHVRGQVFDAPLDQRPEEARAAGVVL